MQAGFIVFFNRSAGVLLGLTGIAKILSSEGSTEILAEPDPVLGVPFKHLLFAVGMTELLVGFFLLFGRRRELQVMLVAWLAINFIVYRLVYYSTGFTHCPCLGAITKQLHVSEGLADMIMMSVLGYLLIGSIGCLFYLRFCRKPQNA